MTIAYRNTMTYETRSYEGWKQWYINFVNDLTEDKTIAISIPEDWWERTQRVLKLEAISVPEYRSSAKQ